MGENDSKEVSMEEMFEMLKNVCKQNSEIKNELTLLRTQFTTFNTEIEAIKTDNISLREENIALNRRVRILEGNNRANNLVLFNIEYDDNEQLHHIVKNILSSKLNVDLELYEIAAVHRLGKRIQGQHGTRPILLSLNSNLKKKEILANVGKLKGTGIGVSEDLSEEERLRKKVFYDHYKAAKVNNCPAKLYKNSVLINGVSYKFEDLEGSRPFTGNRGTLGTSDNQPNTPNADVNADETLSAFGNKEGKTAREIKSGGQTGLGRDTRTRSNSLKPLTSSSEQAVLRKLRNK